MWTVEGRRGERGEGGRIVLEWRPRGGKIDWRERNLSGNAE